MKIPIFIKLMSFSCFLVIVITFSVGFLVLNIQKKQFKEQLIRLGESLIHIVAKNAPDKLLAEEDLALFKLVKDVAENEQIVRAVITNQRNQIMAHSDLDLLSRPYAPPGNLLPVKTPINGISLSTFQMDGKEFFFLEKPLTYQGIEIGKAHIVISQAVIEKNIAESKTYLLVSFVIIISVALLVSLGFSIYFSRPINQLKKSVEIFGTGEYDHQVNIHRKDELGDLAEAFNQMARDIAFKEKVKDSFGRYVAPEIVEKILASPSDQWTKGASKDATVLFTDIRGFTTLSENMAPEHIVEVLNDHFTKITAIIIRHRGYVDKFVGDCAMAVFGIIHENSNHAADAADAALEIMDLLETLARISSPGTAALRIGIGINTGTMISGNVGSSQKMDYTVIGDNVNIASRLTSIAGPGEILISEKTFDNLSKSSYYTVMEKGELPLKGRKFKTRVFQLFATDKHMSMT